jgi:hypothetical protein
MTKVVAKVASVISESQAAFNVGSSRGVAEGNTAIVQQPVTIVDPDTNEELGTVLVPTVTLTITLVDERYSIGTVADVQEGNDIASLLYTQTRRYKKLVRNRTQEKPGISVAVSIGDRVSIEIGQPDQESTPTKK